MSNILKIYKFFPQPIFHFKINNYKKHNANLIKYIYDLQKKDRKGVERSNINGWHSKSFDLRDKNTAGHKFFLEIQKYVAEVFVEYGWKYGQFLFG